MKNEIIQVVDWILVCGQFDLLQSQGKSRHHEPSLRVCTLVYTDETNPVHCKIVFITWLPADIFAPLQWSLKC